MRRSVVTITVWLAVAACASNAQARLDLYVDKTTQRIAVVQDGYMRYVWPISTGRDGYGTPNGTYAPERLERSWFSKEYYNTPMPYAIFFHNGYAIHGSYDIARLGGPASHGCVRLYPQHAAILFEMVEREGPGNTTIVVSGDSQPNEQVSRYRDPAGLSRPVDPGDGGSAKGSYPMRPPQPAYGTDHYPEAPGRPPQPMYGTDHYVEAPVPPPQPMYGTDRYVEAPGRPRGDIGQLATRDVYAPRPHGEIDGPYGPARGTRRQADEPANNRPRPSVVGKLAPEQPKPEQPRLVQQPKPEAPQLSQPKPEPPQLTQPKPEPPQLAQPRPEQSQPSQPQLAQPKPEPQQAGYTVLPKSYWTGASWRWRANPEQEPR